MYKAQKKTVNLLVPIQRNICTILKSFTLCNIKTMYNLYPFSLIFISIC